MIHVPKVLKHFKEINNDVGMKILKKKKDGDKIISVNKADFSL